MMQYIWINAALSGFSPASRLLQKTKSVSTMRSESLLILLLIFGAP